MSASVETVSGSIKQRPNSFSSTKRSTRWPGSLWSFVHSELTRSYELENEEAEYTSRRQKVYGFITVPMEMEKFVSHGFFHCLDSFLFVLTFLPMRIALALSSILLRILTCRGFLIRAAERIDLLKGFVLLACLLAFFYVDTSVVYHSIKSQSTVKLYIMYNMIEVVDRLLSAFGRDTLDALLWTATEPNADKKESKWLRLGLLLVHLVMSLLYVFGHAMVVLMQASTLNVAFNASSNTLLTIMMSNNFVELKGSVFKKFDRKLLFQVACSDIRERFHLFVLLFVVVVQTMKEYGWKEESFWFLAPWCVVVLLVELVIDWCKHAFIARFNEISSEEYKDYTYSLAYDLLQMKSHNTSSDHSDLVARRMGFIPLPLVVVIFRVIGSALKIQSYEAYFICFLAFLGLFSFRILVSIVIMGKACNLMDQRQQSRLSTPSRSGNLRKTESQQSPPMSRRDRHTPTPTPSTTPWTSNLTTKSSRKTPRSSPKASPRPSNSSLSTTKKKSTLISNPPSLRQRSSASCSESTEMRKTLVFDMASDATSVLPDLVQEQAEHAQRSKSPSGEESSSGMEVESLLANMTPLKLRCVSTPDFMDEFLKSSGDNNDEKGEELSKGRNETIDSKKQK